MSDIDELIESTEELQQRVIALLDEYIAAVESINTQLDVLDEHIAKLKGV